MRARVPFSFLAFMFFVGVTCVVIPGSAICARLALSPRCAGWFLLIEIIAFSALPAGLYAGFRFQSEELKLRRMNRVGLWGSLILYIIAIAVVVASLYIRTRNMQ